jgi:lysine biosynthesis protein LysW
MHGMLTTLCPECDAEIKFSFPPNLKQRVICDCCRSNLIVIRLHPIELDWTFLEPIERNVNAGDGKPM